MNDLNGGDLLISYSNGKIIPSEILELYKYKINFHCGPLEFPGRDPHHWAAYYKSNIYGGVCHFMDPAPDTGRIIKHINIKISPNLEPEKIDRIGEECIKKIFLSLVNEINSVILKTSKDSWKGKVRTRKDLLSMCNFSKLKTSEIKHRKYAFSGFEKYFKY